MRVLTLLLLAALTGPVPAYASSEAVKSRESELQYVAEQFAPIFLQELGREARYDYLTRVDFDGDWDPTNNWEHAATYPLPAYVYYSALETETHYFIHYALYHPRDWKGLGIRTGLFGVGRPAAYVLDPTRALLDMTVAHENDFEGVLIVVTKTPPLRVLFAETLAHSRFTRFAAPEYFVSRSRKASKNIRPLTFADGRPVFAIEAKGHGVRDPRKRNPRQALAYRYTGTADTQGLLGQPLPAGAGYALARLREAFWRIPPERAKKLFAKRKDFSHVSVAFREQDGAQSRHAICGGKIGMHLRGGVGANNIAELPWAWEPITWKRFFFLRFGHAHPYPGAWFFDPAIVVKKRFKLGEEFSTVYLSHPYTICEP